MPAENIINGHLFLRNGLLNEKDINQALNAAVSQIDKNAHYFGSEYPTPAANKDKFGVMDNTEWTNGFWTGLLWLAYEYTNDDKYLDLAKEDVKSFENRIDKKIAVNHHDLGFLYIPSTISDYKLTGDEDAREAGIKAADQLATRFQEKGGFIQAWGNSGDDDNYRLIIDALLNIPLFYWASEETKDDKYFKMAESHYKNSINTVIRDDGSTYHTYYFDSKTGKPLKGVTRQGYSDDSSWARGQAWAIYGIALHYHYTKDPNDIDLFKKVLNYFLNKLPEDSVPFWDLIFGDGDDQARDSSAGAIAVCGIHEMLKYLPESDSDKELYRYAMHSILRSLIKNYTYSDMEDGQPILDHSVYSWHSGKGVDEGNIWGDYFYMEALIRFQKDWNLYW
ncbi:glycoside hydrolase family 88 protein [Companilactobacillus hulinensis]|uniref:glycoside hydrolase family 88 protein n=1 Tax=Companilactobacillus hulinensis TaxID=2486007 RepID=UPI000F7B8ADB|nr:glycoside hydrolase family 88 protein [Companilactobacillus hulinensis]